MRSAPDLRCPYCGTALTPGEVRTLHRRLAASLRRHFGAHTSEIRLAVERGWREGIRTTTDMMEYLRQDGHAATLRKSSVYTWMWMLRRGITRAAREAGSR